MFLYRILSIIFFPLVALYIFWRTFSGKESKSRLQERFAIPTIVRPQGDLFWIHAVSVGETNSSLILVEELLKNFPQTSILFTTTTITSATILANKIKDHNGRIVHQFLPVDSYFVVKKFLKFWQPKKIAFIESEIWPNFIFEAKKLEIPTFLINARISKKSFLRWKFIQKFALNIFDYFTKIFAQSEEDQKRLQCLTGQEVLHLGNLKAQALTLEFDKIELQNLRQQIAARKFWLAASTHNGEEEMILSIHKKLRQKFPDLLTIIVPRHPSRSLEIQGLMTELKFCVRSLQQKITEFDQIYLADTLGELGLFYALSDFAFLGGSLVEVGGHNPFELAQLHCAIITGRHFANNKTAFEYFLEKKSCICVENKDELHQVVEMFLQNIELAQELSNKAFEAIEQNYNIAQKICDFSFS